MRGEVSTLDRTVTLQCSRAAGRKLVIAQCDGARVKCSAWHLPSLSWHRLYHTGDRPPSPAIHLCVLLWEILTSNATAALFFPLSLDLFLTGLCSALLSSKRDIKMMWKPMPQQKGVQTAHTAILNRLKFIYSSALCAAMLFVWGSSCTTVYYSTLRGSCQELQIFPSPLIHSKSSP